LIFYRYCLDAFCGNFQLACGEMAGVTAALFTTPFDVVKTRIQTQVPFGKIMDHIDIFFSFFFFFVTVIDFTVI
jgi:Mitochondrial carrier protein